MDEFKRLSLAPCFNINLEELENKYFQLQRTLHPDNFIGATSLEKDFSKLHSAALNQGYTILKDPLKRAEHLLKIQGFDLSNKNTEVEDPNLLIEVMEMREAVDEAKSAGTLVQISNHIRHRFEKGLVELESYFSKRTYAQAFNELQRLKYIENILHECVVQLKKIV